MNLRTKLALAASTIPVACSPASKPAEMSTPRPKTARSLPVEVVGDESAAPRLANGQGPASAEPAATIVVATTSTTTPAIDVADFTPSVTEPVGDVEWMVRQTFPEDPETAARIAWCESRFDPRAISADGANWGLLQINVVHKARAEAMGFTWAQMLDPIPNLAVAHAIYQESGWRPWTCK